MSINRGINKEDVVRIYNEILLSHKKEQNNAICSHMDGPRDYPTKWSQTEKDKYPDITYMWKLKKKKIQMILFTKQNQTQRHGK